MTRKKIELHELHELLLSVSIRGIRAKNSCPEILIRGIRAKKIRVLKF
jgi:hypothetical protein